MQARQTKPTPQRLTVTLAKQPVNDHENDDGAQATTA
jgi:hypothetical protein